MTNHVKTPKPLACSVDAGGVKRTIFNAKELRRFIKGTDEKVFFVETADGQRAPIVVGPLRACLTDLEKRG